MDRVEFRGALQSPPHRGLDRRRQSPACPARAALLAIPGQRGASRTYIDAGAISASRSPPRSSRSVARSVMMIAESVRSVRAAMSPTSETATAAPRIRGDFPIVFSRRALPLVIADGEAEQVRCGADSREESDAAAAGTVPCARDSPRFQAFNACDRVCPVANRRPGARGSRVFSARVAPAPSESGGRVRDATRLCQISEDSLDRSRRWR